MTAILRDSYVTSGTSEMPNPLKQTLTIIVIMTLAFISSACSQERDGTDCQIVVKGEKLFVGTAACLSHLPSRRLIGYVSIGHEEAVFFENKRQLAAFLSGDVPPEFLTWLYRGKWRPASPSHAEGGKDRIIYAVDFDGSITKSSGVYGHMGLYDAGVIVENMRSYHLYR